MATEFVLTVAHDEALYVRQAASEAWRELDRLEELLSSYNTHSDVARISRARAGTSLGIAAETCDCLSLALQAETDTDGAFNIAYRHRPPMRAAALLELHDVPPSVLVGRDHVQLDLGGIGKGFALDRLGSLLAQWDLHRFLLRASASTLLAGLPPPGEHGWRAEFGPPEDRRYVRLCRAALSGSGTAVKGEHILVPQTGRPASRFSAAWAAAPLAALADAYSTGLMAMSPSAIEQFCKRCRGIAAFALECGSRQVRVFAAMEPLPGCGDS